MKFTAHQLGAVVLLLGNFLLMASAAKEIDSGQRIIRVWSQTAADFVQSPVTSISSAFSNYFGSISNLRSAQSENDLLKQRVQELEVELKQKEELASENGRLKAFLQLKEQSKYKVLTAQIIGRDPSVWFDASIVNRGSLDGVALNMPVVTDGGLVGRITAVSPLTSQVDLITRDKSGLGAVIGQISESTALGVVSGTSKKDPLGSWVTCAKRCGESASWGRADLSRTSLVDWTRALIIGRALS